MDILTGIQNTGLDTANLPPPQDKNARDHGGQLPEDDKFDTRPDKDPMDVVIADFLKRLEAREQELYAGLFGALSHLPVPGKVDPKGLSVRGPRSDGGRYVQVAAHG